MWGYSKAFNLSNDVMSTNKNSKYILKYADFKNKTFVAKTWGTRGQYARIIHFQSFVHSKKIALPLR